MLEHIPASAIVVKRADRQRRLVADLDGLQASIAANGILNPIIIDEDNVLIAGERRLSAARRLDKDYLVPVRRFASLSPETQSIIELEENLKRVDLEWKDECLAFMRLHDAYLSQDPTHTLERTARLCSVDHNLLCQRVSLGRELLAGNPLVCKAVNMSEASSKLRRETRRAVDNELNSLFQTFVEPEADLPPEELPPLQQELNQATAPRREPSTATRPAPLPTRHIHQADFIAQLRNYSGKKFNFIHCDFPYGINHGESELGGVTGGNARAGAWEAYDDSPDVYWSLTNALISSADKLMLPSCHIMFWLSMKFYSETVDLFERAGFTVDPIPLIWLKTDNKGIIRDPAHTPRNICEYALLITRGNREIITPIANAYACPTYKSKAIHVSEKPEPMLKHFFRMFIDQQSEMLDPTCGSGSAIRAAHELSAKSYLGWELNPEFADHAHATLTTKINLAKLTAKGAPND
jgi:ParB family chromosome partitioning protein